MTRHFFRWLLPAKTKQNAASILLADARTRVICFDFDSAEDQCRRILALSNRADEKEPDADRAIKLLKAIEHNRACHLYKVLAPSTVRPQDRLASSSTGFLSRRLGSLAEEFASWITPLRKSPQADGWIDGPTDGHFRVRSDDKGIYVSGAAPRNCELVYMFANELLLAATRTMPTPAEPKARMFTFRVGKAGLALFPRAKPVRIALSTGRNILLHDGTAPYYPLSWPDGAGGIEHEIRAGAILTKHGGVRCPPDNETVNRWLKTYDALSKFMETTWQKGIFLYYGSLLGAVRDNGIIPSDDDFDVAYFSERRSPGDVKEEMIGIITSLAAFNPSARLRLMKFSFKINLTGGAIDVFPTWHDGEYLWSPWSTRLRCDGGVLRQLKETDFLGHRVLIPDGAETFLELKYGPGWRRPDPAYQIQPQSAVEFPFRRLRFSEADRNLIVDRARQLAKSGEVAPVVL